MEGDPIDVQKLATKFCLCLETVEFNGIDYPLDYDGVTVNNMAGKIEVVEPIDDYQEPLSKSNDGISLKIHFSTSSLTLKALCHALSMVKNLKLLNYILIALDVRFASNGNNIHPSCSIFP